MNLEDPFEKPGIDPKNITLTQLPTPRELRSLSSNYFVLFTI